MSLEAKIRKEFENSSKKKKKRTIASLAKKYNLKHSDIMSIIQKSNKPKRSFWKPALAIAGVAALAFAGYFYSTPPLAYYQKGNGIYYKHEVSQDAERPLRRKFRLRLSEEFPGLKKGEIIDLKGRHFYYTLDKSLDLKPYQDILSTVKEEFRALGLSSNYQIKQLRNVEDLARINPLLSWFGLGRKDPTPVWIVKSVNILSHARFKIVDRECKVQTGRMELDTENNAETSGYFDLSKSRIRFRRGNVFVRAHSTDNTDIYAALFCEPLHDQVAPISEKFINKVARLVKKKDGTYAYDNLKNQIHAQRLTDEAIVHGIYHDWLKDNFHDLGLTQDDLEHEIQEKDGDYSYKGVKIIRALARTKGRKAVLDDYRKAPVKYWHMLQRAVPEFSKIPN